MGVYIHFHESKYVYIHVRASACVQDEAKDVEGKSTKLLINQNNTLCSQQQSPLSSDS